jgi:phage terminase large subunit-like protein
VVLDQPLVHDLVAERARIQALPPSPYRNEQEQALTRSLQAVGWWEPWVQTLAGGYASGDFSTYQRDFWNWFVPISGERPDPVVACWPRGGGKTTTVQLILLWAATSKLRPYVLYIGKSQSAVEDKVEAVGKLLMSQRVAEVYPDVAQVYVAETGAKRDWRRSRIRTASDFTLDAMGMDQAMRGAKVEEDRPGIIVLDDIEDFVDTPYMTQKRIDVLTRSIIPAASTDCIFVFVQNKIHSDSIMARLLDDRADFLADREVLGPYPQIEDMVTEEYKDDRGRLRHRIVAGTPTWPEELGIEVSNQQLADEGLVAFLGEKQHETDAIEGTMFPKRHWQYVDSAPMDKLQLRRCWDLAGTEDGGDYTVGCLMGRDMDTGFYYVLDVVRHQYGTAKVEKLVQETTEADVARYVTGGPRRRNRYKVCIEKQVGPAGDAWNRNWKANILPGHPLEFLTPQGSKEYRADGYSGGQQREELFLVKPESDDLEDDWRSAWVWEHAQFDGEGSGRYDDQVDTGAMCYNTLSKLTMTPSRPRTAAGRSL